MVRVFQKIYRKLHSSFWGIRCRLSSNNRLRNIIFFESSPDLSDNTKAVFDEMLRRGMNRRYKLVWLLYKSDVRLPSDIPNVYYLPHWDPQAKYYSKVARIKICCNRFLEKESDGQLVFYLSHGTGMKMVRGQYNLPHWVDYCIAASPNLVNSHAYELSFLPEKTYGLGFPRNDILFSANAPIRNALGTDCAKIIVWYPTFRQHHSVVYTAVTNPIPPLDDMDCARRLNEAATACNTMIVIKPHPAQDIRYIKEMNLSNIRFIDDGFFSVHGISSYEFVGSCDALITDFSSIYYDYTLCDRPIALVWSDLEDFTKKHPLVDNHEFLTQGGEKIYTLEELCRFIQRVSRGEDTLQAQRREIRDYTNIDDRSSQRVVDFIIEKAVLNA